MLATGGEIELGFIICSGTEQVGYFLFGCQPHCRGAAVDLFPTVGAAIRQRRIFKAVMAGIAEIVIQVFSPRIIHHQGIFRVQENHLRPRFLLQ